MDTIKARLGACCVCAALFLGAAGIEACSDPPAGASDASRAALSADACESTHLEGGIDPPAKSPMRCTVDLKTPTAFPLKISTYQDGLAAQQPNLQVVPLGGGPP